MLAGIGRSSAKGKAIDYQFFTGSRKNDQNNPKITFQIFGLYRKGEYICINKNDKGMNQILNMQLELGNYPSALKAAIKGWKMTNLTRRIYVRGMYEKKFAVMVGHPDAIKRKRKGEKYRPIQYWD